LILPGGGRVVSLPGRDPDTLAGLTGNIIFTEFGLFPKGGHAHWRVIFPLATRGFIVIVISTPRGKNHKFFELVNDPETYSVHFCDIYKSIAEDGFVLRDNKGNPTDIETFKRLYGDPVGFDREYGCQFTGDLMALIPWAQLIEASNQGEGLPFSLMRISNDAGYDAEFFKQDLPGGGRLEIGWDVARNGDYAAAWVNHRRPGARPYLRYLALMDNTSFALQRTVAIDAMDARGFKSGVGCGDSTGLGMSDNEALHTRYKENWEPVNFSSKKSELGSRALAAYRDGEQAIPSIEGETKFIATDVYAVQRVQGTGGGDPDDQRNTDQPKEAKLKLAESENPLLPDSHCDIAYANFLSLRAGGIKVRQQLPPPRMRKPVGF
jgi:phage FluMu gp28-like protein